MYIVKLKIGYSEYEFRYADWDECSFIIKSLTEHNSNDDFCIEVMWEPDKTVTIAKDVNGEKFVLADE